MEKFTGNLTEDAKVNTVNGKSVINFTIANNYNKRGADGKWVTKTRFIGCAIWQKEGLAPYLTKGKLVEVMGYIDAQAYTIEEGEGKKKKIVAKSKLVLVVFDLNFLNSTNSKEATAEISAVESTEDLPF